MKILIACAEVRNPFVRMLVEGLRASPSVCSVEHGATAFWTGAPDVDVLHIHWPEGLLDWSSPSPDQLPKLEAALREWRARAPVCVTVHNVSPHQPRGPAHERLYELLYHQAHGMIHLGHASVPLIRARFALSDRVRHSVIPHGMYDCFDRELPKSDARAALGIAEDRFVISCFGALRHVEETRVFVRGVRRARVPNRYAMITGRLGGLSRMSRTVHRLYAAAQPSVRLELGHVPDDRIKYYLNATDVLVIPRLRALNSGNLALGFTFGNVVVGPGIGVIGEILEATGNPTFDPENLRTLAPALEAAHELVLQGKGERNRQYAERHWRWDTIAAAHVDFYRLLAQAGRSVGVSSERKP